MSGKITKHIPNFITCLNLFCGVLAIVFTFEGYLEISAVLILVAAIFDFMDGMTARLLKAYSELGKQLDSLADMVSFGVAPAMILFMMHLKSYAAFSIYELSPWALSIASSAFLVAIFSGLRLAKFNIDTRQENNFIGLPTPANAVLILSYPLIIKYSNHYPDFLYNQYFLLGQAIFSSIMLVANIEMFSLKFKNLKLKENRIRFFFIFISLILLATLKILAIPAIIICYIAISIINGLITKNN